MQIEDKQGADEVALVRKYGNEKYVPPSLRSSLPRADELSSSIRVIFSIGDIDAEQDEAFPEDDEEEQPEESADAGSGGEGDEKMDPEDGEEPSFPVRAAITITKDGVEGALSIDAVAQGQSLFPVSSHRGIEVGTRWLERC